MKKLLLGSSMLIGAGAVAGSAHASDGIKLEVGGFFNTVYMGVFDKKEGDRFGNHRNTDALQHNAEVYFKGETKLDNGLTIGARIELEGENATDQIDKSFVYWSGDFGKVQIGSQNDALENYCVAAPGGTANFSAFSPTLGWGSNDPLKSNVYCKSADNDSQKLVYTTPKFGGFQLAVSYTPSMNAETYVQDGVNGSGTPANPDGTAHHVVTTYATYAYKGEGWGVQAGAGGSWQLKLNHTPGANDGKASAYQTGANFTVGGFSAGGIFEYRGVGGDDNNAWIAGGGAAYAFEPGRSACSTATAGTTACSRPRLSATMAIRAWTMWSRPRTTSWRRASRSTPRSATPGTRTPTTRSRMIPTAITRSASASDRR